MSIESDRRLRELEGIVKSLGPILDELEDRVAKLEARRGPGRPRLVEPEPPEAA